MHMHMHMHIHATCTCHACACAGACACACHMHLLQAHVQVHAHAHAHAHDMHMYMCMHMHMCMSCACACMCVHVHVGCWATPTRWAGERRTNLQLDTGPERRSVIATVPAHGDLSALARASILCVRGPYYECNGRGYVQFSRGWTSALSCL